MGIAHIDDLSTSDFLKVVENIGTYQATEKLDGANLYFGIDKDTDRLFTSREGKRSGATRYFSADEYAFFGGTNVFRLAMIALQNKEQEIRQVLQAGQTVEIEVLFGRQPNAVTYGNDNKSFIAFLRGVNGTPADIVDALSRSLLGTTTEVTAPIVTSSDGKNLTLTETTTVFEFIGPQIINLEILQSNTKIQTLVKDFNDYLNAPAEDMPDSLKGYTNSEIDSLSLSSVKKVDRDAVKQQKQRIKTFIRHHFILPLKAELLAQLAQAPSALSDPKLYDEENIGIEGVVLRDTQTGDLIKLVDKAKFTAINAFNHTVRDQISGTVRSIDQSMPLETRGGVLGHMKYQIAKALGVPDMARAGVAKKTLTQYGGGDSSAIKDFAISLNITDFLGKQRFLLAIIKQASKDLQQLLDEFTKNRDQYKLHLADGKMIGISDEIVRRTLLNFAEAFTRITQTYNDVKKSKSVAELTQNLYGGFVEETDTEPVSEAKSTSKKKKPASNSVRWDNDKKRFVGKDAWQLMNIYFANVFLATLMHKTNDRIGMRLLRDKTNFRMTSLRPEMSPLNFWGYPIWRAGTSGAKKVIGSRAANELNRVVRRIPPAWWKFLHMDLSSGQTLNVNWADHMRTMQMLQQFPGMKFERVSYILKGLFGYENLTYDQKIKVLNALHLYVIQFIPNSPFFARLKDIQRELLFNPNDEEAIMTLNELYEPEKRTDETIDAGAVNAGVVAPLSGPLFSGGKKPNIVKRKRNPAIKFVSFKKPENCKI